MAAMPPHGASEAQSGQSASVTPDASGAESVGGLVHMGTLSRPHGIRGELCVDWFGECLRLLSGVIYLQAGAEAPRRVAGARVRLHRGRPLISLPHVGDRTSAEGLRGVRLLVRRCDLPEPAPGEVYLHDILGYTVRHAVSGAALGVLEAVQSPAGQDVWVIRHPSGREVLFPAVPDFLVAVDEATRELRVAPPEGLLEVYLDTS